MAHTHRHTHSHAQRHTVERNTQLLCISFSAHVEPVTVGHMTTEVWGMMGGELVVVVVLVVVLVVALLVNLMLGERQETAMSHWPPSSKTPPTKPLPASWPSLVLLLVALLGEEILSQPLSTASLPCSLSRPSTLYTARWPPLPQSSPDSQCLI